MLCDAVEIVWDAAESAYQFADAAGSMLARYKSRMCWRSPSRHHLSRRSKLIAIQRCQIRCRSIVRAMRFLHHLMPDRSKPQLSEWANVWSSSTRISSFTNVEVTLEAMKTLQKRHGQIYDIPDTACCYDHDTTPTTLKARASPTTRSTISMRLNTLCNVGVSRGVQRRRWGVWRFGSGNICRGNSLFVETSETSLVSK